MGIILVHSSSSTHESPENRPHLDVSYFKTLPGILKIVELILNLLVIICYYSGPYAYGCDGVSFMGFVSVNALINTALWLGLYAFHIFGLVKAVPWLLVEMIFCGVCSLFYLIASSLTSNCASAISRDLWEYYSPSAYVAASIFGFIAMVCYGFDCLLKFQTWRAERLTNLNAQNQVWQTNVQA